MVLTGTTYPPAGATALLAVVDPPTRALGWYVLALGVLGSVVCVGEGCVVVNAGRRYPTWWWSERMMGTRDEGRLQRGSHGGGGVQERGGGWDVEKGEGRGADDGSERREGDEAGEEEDAFAVIFTSDRIYLPSVQRVAVEKAEVLRMLRGRLEGDGGSGAEIDSSLWDSRSEESIRGLVNKEQRERGGRV